MQRFYRLFAALLATVLIAVVGLAIDEDAPPAAIINDEGGPVVITGEVNYTYALFTDGVSEPLIILEDQTGFVLRDRSYLFPPESQVLGQITSDFYSSPFNYSISLPIEPQAPLNDVDQDDEEDAGVMIFQVAYWSNTFGDGFLQERDLYGGGWSGAYSSAEVSSQVETLGEYIGGNIVIYAPSAGQGFPSGFGADGKLFTADDPIVLVPQGYTVVNMDSEPFTFDRSRNAVIDLIEGEGAEATDFSAMTYTEAFDALIEKFRTEYAFTEHKGLDWDAIYTEYRPLFEEAEAAADPQSYARALQALSWAIPDGHVQTNAINLLSEDFLAQTNGDLGIAFRETTDGRVIVNFLRPDSPADEVGIQLGAEIIAINGKPIEDALNEAVVWSRPFSTQHVLRLQQLRYASRFEVGVDVEVTYRNPDGAEETATMTTVNERSAFAFSSFNVTVTGIELPVEWELVGESTMLVRITSFLDDARLTLLLWERMIRDVQALEVTSIVIDMRNNGGGRGFLSDQLAAYFFQEPLELGYVSRYDLTLGEFYYNEERPSRFFLPPEDLRFDGPVAVIVGPSCISACEFFSHRMTLQDRATIVGHYPSAGAGGGVEFIFLPEGLYIGMAIARALDADGNIILEGVGVVPDVLVPVNEDTLGLTDATYYNDDPLLDAAIAVVEEEAATSSNEEEEEMPSLLPTEDVDIVDGGSISYDEELTGSIEAGQRIQYSFNVQGGADAISFFILGDLDTVLRVYDETGATLFYENDDFAGTENSAFTSLSLNQDLTILIEVGTAGDADSGEYTLISTTGEWPIEVLIEDAGTIAVGETASGEFVAGTRYSYTLELDANSPISISLNAPDDLDTYLRVYDAEGELLAENDDISNQNHNSRIEDFALDEAATVTIVVGTFGDGSVGEYELLVQTASE